MKDEEGDRVLTALAARLKARREELGFSINKLAEKANMTHVGVLKLESGERTPMLLSVLKMSKALDLPLSTILRELGH